MDAHFRLLGIPRGCDEETLRKAYRQKARALHPDRNPAGTEQFKRMNAAYEALRAHFSRNGGRDPVPVTTAAGVGPTVGTTFAFNYGGFYTNAGTAFHYARFARNNTDSPHFFTDEELFGDIPGGFTYEKRVPKYGRSAQTGGAGSANSAGCGWFNKKGGGEMPFGTSTFYNQADERWRRAHGDRVPVSGYSTKSGAAPPPPFSFQHHQRQRQQQQERQQHQEQKQKQQTPQQTPVSPGASQSPRPSCFAADFAVPRDTATDGNNKGKNTRNGTNGGGGVNQRQQQTRVNSENAFSGRSNSNSNRGCSSSSRYWSEKKNKDFWQTPFDVNSTHKSNDESNSMSERTSSVNEMLDELGMQDTFDKIRRDWERLKSDIPCNMSNKTAPASGWRNNKRNGHKLADDDSDEEDEDYVVHQRSTSASINEKYQQMFRERQRLNDTHMRSILEEKLKLKKVLFTQRYSPDPADVALMSDSDVFILCELLRDIEGRMQKVLNGRMTKGLCARCSVAPKLQNSAIFSCGHTSVCEECALTCNMCPVCAALRR